MSTSRSSGSRKGRSRRRQGRSTVQSLVFLLLGFGGLAFVVLLLTPPWGILSSGFDPTSSNLPGILFRAMGLLALFIPAGLLMAAVLVVSRRRGYQAPFTLLGLFATLYFLFTIVHLVAPRLSIEVSPFPGGRIASGITLFLDQSTGPVLAFLILMTAFVTSLVVLTGWDLVADFQSLSKRLGRVLSSLWGLSFSGSGTDDGRVGAGQAIAPTAPADEAGANPWARQEAEPKVSPHLEALPFETRGSSAVVPTEFASPRLRTSPGPAGAAGDSEPEEGSCYVLPPAEILSSPPPSSSGPTQAELRERGRILVEKLADFGISCEVAGYFPGPVITRYELKPGPGVKINRILGLSDDLTLALKAKRIRILAPIPGKGAVGIEIPNANPEIVYLSDVLSQVSSSRQALPLALGKSLEGKPFITDLCRMPHVLIAGATGSGKSVCIHSIISTLLMKMTPYQVRLALVDPKMLELSAYQDVPHLWGPVVVEARKAHFMLEDLVEEMEDRYSLLARAGVRSISEYNEILSGQSDEERMPYIVLIIDELADLMALSANEVEQPVTRLAQMARAVGIHLLLATQRPSVDVITGLIKANFPARIAFNVQSKTDSRTVLDMNGAEKLLGNGDMLFLPPSSPEPIRVHGSYVSTEEARRIVEHWADQPKLPHEFTMRDSDEERAHSGSGTMELDDPLLEQARDLVVQHQQGSVSLLQRRLRVGYSRAARLIDMLEQMGVVGKFQGSKARDVLVGPPGSDDGGAEDGEGTT
ncbi:DNA translocase FtsK [Candidatus Fermentibacterales bacterium]|nr:DNA translocase FtsK [Candidatus Fermentibacterales bacterium]